MLTWWDETVPKVDSLTSCLKLIFELTIDAVRGDRNRRGLNDLLCGFT